MASKSRDIGCFVLFCLLLPFLLAGCGEPDISAYADEEITLIGLTEEPIIVTVAELNELKIVTKSAKANTQSASDARVKGPLLETVAAQYGRDLTEFFMVRVTASDQFEKKFRGADLAEAGAVLGIFNNGKALTEKYAPLYLVVPDTSSGDWVRMVTTIEFVLE